MIEISLNEDQKKDFQKNGFLIIESFLDTTHFERLYERFHSLFNGNFETGIEPDEWNWKFESGPKDVTRQICNAWKSDNSIKEIVCNKFLKGIIHNGPFFQVL